MSVIPMEIREENCPMKKLAAAAVILVSTSLSAMAAPFCLAIPGAAPQCMYVDGNQCQADALRQSGACQPNPAEIKMPTSRIGEYCMLLPVGFTHCGYADGIACARDALREHGVCAKSAGTIPPQVPDPFNPNAGR
jgi:hypothetical protein